MFVKSIDSIISSYDVCKSMDSIISSYDVC